MRPARGWGVGNGVWDMGMFGLVCGFGGVDGRMEMDVYVGDVGELGMLMMHNVGGDGDGAGGEVLLSIIMTTIGPDGGTVVGIPPHRLKMQR